MLNVNRRTFLRGGTSLLAFSGTVLSRPARAQSTGNPVRGGILVIAQDANPPSLDPHKSAAFATTNITEQIYGCLLRWDDSGTKVEPDLAASYEMVDDLTYRFTLRDGVKFHNGQTLTSADVKFTFDRIANPDTASPWKSLFAAIQSVETPDARSVIFHLSAPFSPLLNYLATVKYSAIVSQADVTQRGDLISGGAGTGPFKFGSFVSNSVLKLSRNEDYYEPGLPYLDGLEFRIIPDEGSRVASLRSGSAALTWLNTPEVVDQLAKTRGFVTPKQQDNNAVLLMELDQRVPPFNDVRVRRAFSLAIDRQQIADIVWRGRAVLSAAIPPAQAPYAVPSAEVLALPYQTPDLTQAKALMAEAGHASGFDTVFAVSPQTSSDVAVAQIVQQQVARIGIRIKIEQKDWGSLVKDFQGTLSPISMADLAPAPDAESNLRIRFATASSVNPGKTKDPEIDALFTEGRATTDVAKRVAIYREMQHRIADQAYALFPAAIPLQFEIWSEKLHGYHTTPYAQRVLLRQAWLASGMRSRVP
jgi:peptide/nickel transport system substrate-binding protein